MHLGTASDKGVMDVRTADLLFGPINTVDVYTPKTNNSNAILRAIEQKNSQSSGVIIKTDFSSADINFLKNHT